MEKSNRDADVKLLDKIKAFGATVKNALVQAQILTRSIPVIIEQPVSVYAPSGTDCQLHVEAENIASYQWQYQRKTGGSWTSSTLSGAQTDTITTQVTSSRQLYWFRCQLTGIDNSIIYTDNVEIMIQGE